MTDRAPSRRPMMFSRLVSGASSPAAACGLAAEAHAGRADAAVARQLQRALLGGQRELRQPVAGGVGGHGEAVAAQRVERGQARGDVEQVDVGAAGQAPAALHRLDRQARRGQAHRAAHLHACSTACPGRPARRWATGRSSRASRPARSPCGRARACSVSEAVPFRQQAWRARSSRPRPLTPTVQSSRPGSALASRLPGPPVSTTTALPDQTVPRASASSRCWLVAEATRSGQPGGGREHHHARPARRPRRRTLPSAWRRRATCPRRSRRRSTRPSRWLRRCSPRAEACGGGRSWCASTAAEADDQRAAVALRAARELCLDRPRARGAARLEQPAAQGLGRRRR